MIQVASGIAMTSETLFPYNLGKQIPFDRFVDDALDGWYRTFRNPLQPTPQARSF